MESFTNNTEKYYRNAIGNIGYKIINVRKEAESLLKERLQNNCDQKNIMITERQLSEIKALEISMFELIESVKELKELSDDI